ncbi:MAG: ester cyclase [Planctomycetota bacterium]|jgi:hypothetical protein
MFLLINLILILIILLIALVGVKKATADTEANRAIVHRVFEELVNQKNLSLIDEFYATDYVYRVAGIPDVHGSEDFKQFSAMLFAAFPDVHYGDHFISGANFVVKQLQSHTTWCTLWTTAPLEKYLAPGL